MAGRRWLSSRVLSWALYDVGSSAYLIIVPIILFPIYFRSFLAGNHPLADAWWGLVGGGAFVIAGLTAPFAGARADRTGQRTVLLACITLVCCVATALLGTLGSSNLILGACLFIVAQTAAVLSQALYDSYVTHIAPPGLEGRVSSFGWGIGFFGGILAIVLVLWIAGGRFDAGSVRQFRLSFLLVAGLYAAFATVSLLGLARVGGARSVAPRTIDQPSVVETLSRWREQRNVFMLLLAIYLINDALVTMALFISVTFASAFGVSVDGLLRLALLYHVIAVPATFLLGYVGDRWSLRNAIWLSLILWGATLLLIMVGRGSMIPTIAISLFALGFGSTQALLRALYARMVPLTESGKFFGFNAVTGRLSAATGPIVFGVISSATGSPRLALLSILAFVVAGMLVLGWVDLSRLRIGLHEPASMRS
jgi:UMF1 family MFS transporter